MYRFVYDIPFPKFVLMLVLFFIFWCWSKERFMKKKLLIWKWSQLILLIVSLSVFLWVSLFSRTDILEQQWPQVFWSYRLAFGEGSYDYFQEIYLNIVSFLFISLFASELFPTNSGKIAVFGICVILSILVECIQYVFSLGLAEIDDIISNILGSMSGIVSGTYGYRLYYETTQVIKRWKKRNC